MKDIDFSCGWGSNYIHLLKWTEELKDNGYCFPACHTADTGVGLEVKMFPFTCAMGEEMQGLVTH